MTTHHAEKFTSAARLCVQRHTHSRMRATGRQQMGSPLEKRGAYAFPSLPYDFGGLGLERSVVIVQTQRGVSEDCYTLTRSQDYFISLRQ